MEDGLSLKAYAKINLGLRVLRKRADGYHDLETVYHRIDLHDTLECHPSRVISVESDSEAAPGGEANLCHRAALALRDLARVDRGIAVRLVKRIPVGAGLGGGSSDAAALLRALPGFWGINVPESDLLTIASGLGADVPYFLHSGSAAATGRGEVLEYFTLDLPFAILLCNPGIGVSTAWAYARITPHDEAGCPSLRSIIERGIHDPRILRELVNDFEGPVFQAHPPIARIKEEMLSGGALFASMSGSGSSVFGLFPAVSLAGALATEFRSRGFLTSVTPPFFRPEPA